MKYFKQKTRTIIIFISVILSCVFLGWKKKENHRFVSHKWIFMNPFKYMGSGGGGGGKDWKNKDSLIYAALELFIKKKTKELNIFI